VGAVATVRGPELRTVRAVAREAPRALVLRLAAVLRGAGLRLAAALGALGLLAGALGVAPEAGLAVVLVVSFAAMWVRDSLWR
jgi:hypothetical protein